MEQGGGEVEKKKGKEAQTTDYNGITKDGCLEMRQSTTIIK